MLPSSLLRTRKRLLGGALVGVVAVSAGAYLLLFAAHESDAKTTTSTTITTAAATDLPVRIERTIENLALPLDQPCAESGRLPLILHSSASGAALQVLSSASPMSELSTKLTGNRRIAVVRTLSLAEPHASIGLPAPGRYEGQLVVIDTANGAALCHTKVLAWSSSIVEHTGIGDRALRDDFNDRIRAAFSDASTRLHVDLEL